MSIVSSHIQSHTPLTRAGDSRNPLLTQFLFSFLVVVVTVVAMNGYIALLGDSYSNVKEKQTAIQTLNRTR